MRTTSYQSKLNLESFAQLATVKAINNFNLVKVTSIYYTSVNRAPCLNFCCHLQHTRIWRRLFTKLTFVRKLCNVSSFGAYICVIL